MGQASLAPAPEAPARLLLVLVDGVGLAAAAHDNPLATAPMPALQGLLGGPLTIEQVQVRSGLCLRAIDANLGVPGLPQSATGHTSLYTGENAARRLGHHVAAFPGPRLRHLLARRSVFRTLAKSGLQFTLANAYSPRYAELVRERRLRWPASVWALWAAGGRLRGLRELERGRAVTWDVERDLWGGGGAEVPSVTPERAGSDLAGLAAAHRLTLYETHLTDLAGHGRQGVDAKLALGRIDGLLRGLIGCQAPDVTVVVVSDHGNLEDATHRRHTRNPVPLLAFGPHAANFRRVRTLPGVVPAILRALGLGAPGRHQRGGTLATVPTRGESEG
jgi:hypothetical protein